MCRSLRLQLIGDIADYFLSLLYSSPLYHSASFLINIADCFQTAAIKCPLHSREHWLIDQPSAPPPLLIRTPSARDEYFQETLINLSFSFTSSTSKPFIFSQFSSLLWLSEKLWPGFYWPAEREPRVQPAQKKEDVTTQDHTQLSCRRVYENSEFNNDWTISYLKNCRL